MDERADEGTRGAPAPVRRQVNMRDVAQAAGVALSSASRALSGHPDVRDETRERVRAAADALGYEHNLVWESLRRGSTRTVGLVVRDISSPLFAEIALKADMAFRDAGYSLLVSNSFGDLSQDVLQVRLLNQRRVDGLILSPADVRDPAIVAALERLPVPFVVIDRDLPSRLGASAVLIDQRAGMRKVVEHLLDLGHRSIGYVAPSDGTRPAYETVLALREGCDARGARYHVEYGAFSEEHGERAIHQLLDKAEPPTALIAGSNQIFPGVVRALRVRGVRVPDDLSLVTLDELPLLPYLDPSVTALSRQPGEVGRVAAELMLERLEGGPPKTVVTPTDFTVRNSSGPAPGS